MFKNTKKEKFSLRKYKDGRTDSKLIGAIAILGIAMLAGGGTASANVSSNVIKFHQLLRRLLQMIKILRNK